LAPASNMAKPMPRATALKVSCGKGWLIVWRRV
jgi:hypothetical protein